MKKGKLFVVLTAVFSLFLASCEVEIGLGAAVDTEAAKLNVDDTPKAGDVVRSYFKLSGTCTDDTEIQSLTITFENTDGKGKDPVVFSTLPYNKDGNWAIIIDPRQEIASAKEAAAKAIADGDEYVPEVPSLPDGIAVGAESNRRSNCSTYSSKPERSSPGRVFHPSRRKMAAWTKGCRQWSLTCCLYGRTRPPYRNRLRYRRHPYRCKMRSDYPQCPYSKLQGRQIWRRYNRSCKQYGWHYH